MQRQQAEEKARQSLACRCGARQLDVSAQSVVGLPGCCADYRLDAGCSAPEKLMYDDRHYTSNSLAHSRHSQHTHSSSAAARLRKFSAVARTEMLHHAALFK